MNIGTSPILPLSGSLFILHWLETIHEHRVWYSPIPFQCSNILTHKLQIQPKGNCLPGPMAAFIFKDKFQLMGGLGVYISKIIPDQKPVQTKTKLKTCFEQIFFSEKILWGVKRMTFKKCFWKFLESKMFSRRQFGLIPNGGHP